ATATPAPAAGFTGGLVELTNGRETYRELTDADGEVVFDHLRPGIWTLKVHGNDLPAHHVIENPIQQIELAPGESGRALVRVLPKIRPIRFLDQGEITTVSARTPPASQSR